MKPKNSNGDKSQNFNCDNTQTQIVTKLKNSNCDKTEIVTKLIL